jgi:hypothetical protein
MGHSDVLVSGVTGVAPVISRDQRVAKVIPKPEVIRPLKKYYGSELSRVRAT